MAADNFEESVLWDFSQIMKASQMISHGSALDEVLVNMTEIMLTSIGAKKGSLILEESGEMRVRTQSQDGKVFLVEDTKLELWKGPRRIVQYVVNSGEAINLSNVTEDFHFRVDPYVVEHSLKSVLCMPIMIRDEQVIGVLYAENNEIEGAFTVKRESLLSVLIRQTAVSLGNVRLMQKLLNEQKERMIETERDQSRLEDFVDTIFHEMRNPLHGIVGGVTLLGDEFRVAQSFRDALSTDLHQDYDSVLTNSTTQLDVIANCAEQQKHIIGEALDLSKIANNRIDLRPARFNLRAVIASAVQMCAPSTKKAAEKISLKLPPEEIYVIADARRLAQVLINLLSNAIKFGKGGNIIIKAKLERLTATNAHLFISLKDHGIGMTEDELSLLFSRFSQTSSQISSQYGGSGLGLAICKKMVERMGGSFTVKSEKGVGSKFKFFIGCQISEETETERSSLNLTSPASPAPERFMPRRILVVEDNLTSQLIVKRYLEQRRHHVRIASNGVEGVDMFVEFQPHLIMMDVELPKLNGLDATKMIRRKESESGNLRIPIIGLSGNARTAQIEEALAAGFDDYLTKPFGRHDLFEMLDKYLPS
eukprot:TRINITY_DN1967_c0_g1_i1.p1 TRINITY_DN1967_c0_g1~~TRINITY_DN1967_c0_g1_i1.p1  ORF type:complete len:632 (+),score=158.88 TRINITY_DN1967_c0_g1_i1:120-1898(+)